ncbi:MAG TPA: alpha/beta hydrolase [Chitinophagaceae bacterium]|nr:alpha/beta hydrolase [Chitinophagaceae bacterium]
MPKKKQMADYILPLNINGLQGRMLRMPPPKNKRREIMFVYGHHSSLERNFGVAEFLNQYGGVTVPDLPGFGGMDPFYKIGRQPTLDDMADYLAAFIRLRYKKNQRFDLTGLSLGFIIVTRMLQKYPEIAGRVNILVSFAGFAKKDDFRYKKSTYYLFRAGTWVFSRRLPAAFLKYVAFRGAFIRLGYKYFEPFFIDESNTKIRRAGDKERQKRIEFEIFLWQCNDPRTYMSIAHTMFTLDLTGRQVNHSVYHVAIEGDRYFENVRVEQHMRRIFRDFILVDAKLPAHAPSIIASAKEAAPYVPPQLRKLLSGKAKV